MRSATKKKLGKDPAYLAWLHTLPCVICEGLRLMLLDAGFVGDMRTLQSTKTEAAHVGERGLSQKCPDREAIPLCGFAHHREGPASAHKLGKSFWKYWKLDRGTVIEALNAKYDAEHETVIDAREAMGISA